MKGLHLRVFYSGRMSVPSGGFSPSGDKPRQTVEDWISHDLPIEVVDFEPVTIADLCLAHDPEFVRDVLACRMPNGHGNRKRKVTESCRWTCGSMLAAARQAIFDGIACSPSSGFHHAGWNCNGAFCTFNGLIIAALKLQAEKIVRTVGILDCDAHYGDGTQDIIDRLQLSESITHWTFGGQFSRSSFRFPRFCRILTQVLDDMTRDGADLILYQAGADPHLDDPLGGFMTSEELRLRDRLVFTRCRELGVPVAYCHAGGYQLDSDGSIRPVLAIHRATIEEALLAMGHSVSN